jgi:hypothetical protein
MRVGIRERTPRESRAQSVGLGPRRQNATAFLDRANPSLRLYQSFAPQTEIAHLEDEESRPMQLMLMMDFAANSFCEIAIESDCLLRDNGIARARQLKNEEHPIDPAQAPDHHSTALR